MKIDIIKKEKQEKENIVQGNWHKKNVNFPGQCGL